MAAQFSFKRLGRLIQKHWVENRQYHLFAALALIGAISLVLLIWVLSGGNHYEQSDLVHIFLFGLYICGAVYASSTFKMLQKKESGTYWLSIPASHLEKLITAIFYNIIVFTIVFTLCYFLVAEAASSIITARVKANQSFSYSYRLFDWQNISGTFNIYKCFIYIYFGVQALYMLGSIYFKKYSFILTTFTLAVIITILTYYINYLSSSLPQNYHFVQGSVKEFNASGMNQSVHYELPIILEKVLLWLICFGWAPVFWWATYYRLKEKEI